jgi:ABC-type maltose transport system permease subunit
MSNIQKATARAATPISPTRPAVAATRLDPTRRNAVIRQILMQMFLLAVLATVIFPVLWIISMAIDPRGISRPTDLTLFPANATLSAFYKLLREPFSNVLPIYFGDMLMNSLFVAFGTAVFTAALGASAAYSFSRFRFIGREAGLLVFIVLLMLPATGTLIPLLILFNSIQVNSGLAIAVPSFFSAGVVCAIIYMAYRMTAGYLKYDPERSFNPKPLTVTVAVAIVALMAIILTFAVMLDRNPAYKASINAPMIEAEGPLLEAQNNYSRRSESLPRSQRTAEREERQAETAAQEATDIVAINEAAQSSTDLNNFLQTEIDARQGTESLLVETLTSVQAVLISDGEEVALTALAEGVTTLQAEAADAADAATRARENATEAEGTLAEAEAQLAQARADFDVVQGRALTLRTNVMVGGLLPYYLAAWAAVLIGAAAVWGVVYLLRNRFEPRPLVNILLCALLVAVFIGLGISAYQARLPANAPPTVTLRVTLFGLAVAFLSGGLPFTIWNLKGYFDTIPKDLEQAALIDGAGRIGTFFRIILPLSLPAFAITILFSFMGSWTEYILSWIFLTGNTQDYTLAMALVSMAAGANSPPPDMQKFAAMAILISLPILTLFFAAQRYVVSGLTIGAVK